MNSVIKYSWTFSGQLHNILRVPIMSVSKERNVDEARLAIFVESFNKDKNSQYFPRVFIGHHKENEDRLGVGFIDNLVISTFGVDNEPTLFADLVDIPYHVFCKIKNDLSYPYLSVEVTNTEICGLALLDSQPPYFKFPRLVLENEGAEAVTKFSKQIKSFRSYQMAEEKPVEEKKENMQETGENKEGAVETEQHMSEEMKLLQEILAQIKILASSNKPAAFETSVNPAIKANEPTSVAYSDKSLRDKFSVLEAEVHQLRLGKRVDSLVENKGISRAYLEKTLSGFSNNKDREHFLSVLESSEQNISFSSSASKANYASDFSPEKYSSAGKDVALARKASDCYQQTKNHPDKRMSDKFCAIWPSKDKFVEHVLAMSITNPDYLNTLTIKE